MTFQLMKICALHRRMCHLDCSGRWLYVLFVSVCKHSLVMESGTVKHLRTCRYITVHYLIGKVITIMFICMYNVLTSQGLMLNNILTLANL